MSTRTAISMDELTLRQQDYIESIAQLIEKEGQARTTDIAGLLGVKMPSVSEEIHRLVDIGVARRKSWHEIVLTPRGLKIAAQLHSRQSALHRFMVDVLAMESDEAESLSCRIEHFIDKEFVTRLLRLAEFLDSECSEHQAQMRNYVTMGK